MKQEQAIEILLGAARIGQSRGAYTLEDAKIIAMAVELLTPKKEAVKEEVKEEVKEVEVKEEK